MRTQFRDWLALSQLQLTIAGNIKCLALSSLWAFAGRGLPQLLAFVCLFNFAGAADIFLVGKDGAQAPFSANEVKFAPIRTSRISTDAFDDKIKILEQRGYYQGRRQTIQKLSVGGNLIAVISQKNPDITMLPSLSLFIETEVIVVHGPIEMFDSARMEQALLQASKRNPNMRSLQIVISSPGGLYLEGLKTYDAIRAFSDKSKGVSVTTITAGPGAWSAGGIIWAAGDRMVITPGSAVGFHPAYNPKTNETSEELVAELEAIVSNTFGQLKKPRHDIAKSLSEYVRAAFNTFGSGMFFIIDDNGKIDLWEDSRQKLFFGGEAPWVQELDYAFLDFLFRTRNVWTEGEKAQGTINVHYPAFKKFHTMERSSHDVNVPLYYAIIPPSVFFDWSEPDRFYSPLDSYSTWVMEKLQFSESSQLVQSVERLNTLDFTSYRKKVW